MRNSRILKILIVLLIVFTGITARFLALQRGYNADYVSWQTVAKIANSGGNVYAETQYYNYGPVWFHCLHLFAKISNVFPNQKDEIFRLLIVGFLTSADVGIFVVLYRQYSRLVAALFFLNPISIIITGYHNQFDNVAIFIGLCAVILIDDQIAQPFITKRKLLGFTLLGCSLMTKHILFLFPFWVAAKQKTRLAKILALFVPISIFLLGFAPYWSVGKEGIIQNVFQYNSSQAELFYALFAPRILQLFITSTQLWFVLLLLFAVVFRKQSQVESLLFYLMILVFASPALAGQYLVIVVPTISRWYKNLFFACYTIIASVFFTLHPAELHYVPTLLLPLVKIPMPVYWGSIISVLSLGFFWELIVPFIPEIRQKIAQEIRQTMKPNDLERFTSNI